MSKKTQQIKQLHKSEIKKRVFRTSLRFVIFSIVCFTIYLSYQFFASPQAKVANACINNENEAKQVISNLPEVSKYFKKLENSINKPYIKIDVNFGHQNETRVGYAYVGQKTENNSQQVYAKYVFSTGCNVEFQKEPNSDPKIYGFVNFIYRYKMSENTYTDETTTCINKLSKMKQVDFDNDGEFEYLYGCYVGGISNSVNYTLYKSKIGIIYPVDSFKSAGDYEEFVDFNGDGYYDIATPGILMYEGDCKADQCFAPHKDKEVKVLLKRSYHRLWNPKTGKFDPPIKAEIYFEKNFKRYFISDK